MEKGTQLEKTRLDTEYLREAERYIEELYREVSEMSPDDEAFAEFRERESSNLNRLQKMKNTASYKKEKHKSRTFNDGWE